MGKMIKEHIGNDSLPPYEIFWDCLNVADQACFTLVFHAEIEDSAGNVFQTRGAWAVLDRQQSLTDKKIISQKTKQKITIDGAITRAEGWFNQDSIILQNDDNFCTVYSLWDKKG